MTQNGSDRLIDVRPMAACERHATIFRTWTALRDGEAILLVNDHDPVPLYYQFAAEYAGAFHWEYLDQGPEVWRARIRKGAFPSPGFVPARKAACSCQSAQETSGKSEHAEALVLDTRPIFARGQTPCGEIEGAVAELRPGQPFVLLAPFNPEPLAAKLGQQGFSHQARQLDDGTWRIEFRRQD